MAFSGGLGLALDLDALPVEGDVSMLARCFAEDASRYLLEVDEKDLKKLAKALGELGDVPHAVIGTFNASGELSLAGGSTKVAALGNAWSGGLAW